MNILRWGANMIENTTPTGLIIAGAVLAVASPPVRRGLRSAAVMATRGVLMAAGTVQGAMASMRGNMREVMDEARQPMESDFDEPVRERSGMLRSARKRGRRLAVGAAAGAVAVRDELRSIVEEARQRKHDMAEDYDVIAAEEAEMSAHDTESDGLEAAETNIGHNPPSKRRARAKLQ